MVFDIHYYGDEIVHALGAVGMRRSFASLVKGMENTETCRYMLASLQLVSTHMHKRLIPVQFVKKDV